MLVDSPFRSFWMGGYECSDKLNAFGERVDILTATRHVELLADDYRQLAALGMFTVREGIRWSYVERVPGRYDWTTVGTMIKAGLACGVQQVWDLCHFGFPDNLTPLHPMFARRFAAMCVDFVVFYRSLVPVGTLIVTPINEVNFLSWLGGEVRGTSPYCVNMGFEVKYALMRAYIEGVAAMKRMDADILILATEPLVSIVPPIVSAEEEIKNAQAADEAQFQSLDILTGRMCPELGGQPDYLDIIGCNFYYTNQWEWPSAVGIPWANIPYDVRWQPLRNIFQKVFSRYNKPCILAETSHPGEHRAEWITYVSDECAAMIAAGWPLLGICIYPIIDRPDWDNLSFWHHSGLWDSEELDGQREYRILNQSYATALQAARYKIEWAQGRYVMP